MQNFFNFELYLFSQLEPTYRITKKLSMKKDIDKVKETRETKPKLY